MSRLLANILMCFAALFWGATFIAQKTGMETIGPMGFTFGRYLIGALALAPLAIYETGKISLLAAMRQDKRLCAGALSLGVFMFGGIGLQQTALLYTNVANAAFLTAFYVPLVPLIAALFLRRHIPLNIWPAVIVSLVGSYLLSGTSNLTAQFGDLLTIGGAFFWAGHILLIQSVMSQINAPFQLSFLQSIVTAIIAGLFMVKLETPAPADFLPMLPQLAFAGIVAVGLGFTLQLVAQRYTTAAAAALILSLESVFATFFGWWLLDETLVFMALLGCSLIFLSIILAEVVSEHQLKKIGNFFSKAR
ncbi:DMT family transporter [Candidatus Puniceispirillum sp.]|nr:DMT family transporter [Candidatus Puniceispirillum sp.]